MKWMEVMVVKLANIFVEKKKMILIGFDFVQSKRKKKKPNNAHNEIKWGCEKSKKNKTGIICSEWHSEDSGRLMRKFLS
jgi:uncharacterized Rossmann fold enzyme